LPPLYPDWLWGQIGSYRMGTGLYSGKGGKLAKLEPNSHLYL
jgi:hypothetical protein